MPEHFALIYNPRSRRNLKVDRQYQAVVRAMPSGMCHAPRSHAELRRVIESLSRVPPACIVVDGGDGTVGSVLSALYASSWPHESWPALAVLASGNTNLIAADVGFGLRGPEALRLLQDRLANGQASVGLRRRRPLVVSRMGYEGEDILGFFGGMGAFARGIEIAHQPGVLHNWSHDMAVLVTLVLSFAQLVSPAQRRSWLAGVTADLAIDGQDMPGKEHFMLLCTSLQRLPYGAWPFWTEADQAGKGVSYLDVAAMPKRLFPAAWNLLRGHAPAWLKRSDSYASGRADTLVLQTGQPFVLDGEVLSPGVDGRITISAGPPVSFLQA
ncbi:MAG: diacylglycerol kinase family protein [Acetobacter sp.]|uniref:diacylglycerol/lipid kinase family protein n=1 Tax=Acetobacter sp. TaxID=440 RepID=UPI0039EB2A1C